MSFAGIISILISSCHVVFLPACVSKDSTVVLLLLRDTKENVTAFASLVHVAECIANTWQMSTGNATLKCPHWNFRCLCWLFWCLGWFLGSLILNYFLKVPFMLRWPQCPVRLCSWESVVTNCVRYNDTPTTTMISLAMLQIHLRSCLLCPQSHIILLRWWRPLVGTGVNYNSAIHIATLAFTKCHSPQWPESLWCWGPWLSQSSSEYNLHLQQHVDYLLLCTITGWLRNHPRSI